MSGQAKAQAGDVVIVTGDLAGFEGQIGIAQERCRYKGDDQETVWIVFGVEDPANPTSDRIESWYRDADLTVIGHLDRAVDWEAFPVVPGPGRGEQGKEVGR